MMAITAETYCGSVWSQ